MPSSLLLDTNNVVEPVLRESIDKLSKASPSLGGMAGYHLGYLDKQFASAEPRLEIQGKRVRATLALRSCASVSGSYERAVDLAAAIELLHAFTLVHDDIQDESLTRRHRPTVWSLWGASQGINVGDALFAESTRVLLRSPRRGVGAELVLELAADFQQCAIDIVAGQVADLSFEERSDVSANEYLAMIRAKTGELLSFSMRAGALLGGAGREVADSYGELGAAVGIAFQVRDDYLGIWGNTDHTGKSDSDDIRQRKRSWPVIHLREHLDIDARRDFDLLYAPDSSGNAEEILQLLEQHEIQQETLHCVEVHQNTIDQILKRIHSPFPAEFDQLRSVIDDLSRRIR